MSSQDGDSGIADAWSMKQSGPVGFRSRRYMLGRSLSHTAAVVWVVIILALSRFWDVPQSSSSGTLRWVLIFAGVGPVLWIFTPISLLRFRLRDIRKKRHGAGLLHTCASMSGRERVLISGQEWRRAQFRDEFQRISLPYCVERVFVPSIGPVLVITVTSFLLLRLYLFVPFGIAAMCFASAFVLILTYCATNSRVYSCEDDRILVTEGAYQKTITTTKSRIWLNLDEQAVMIQDPAGRSDLIDLAEVARPIRFAAAIAKSSNPEQLPIG